MRSAPSWPRRSCPAKGAPPSRETLEQAVERHLKLFMAAHKEGMPIRDLHERVISEVERPLLRLALRPRAATRSRRRRCSG
jgi:two-component system nitrogen regulation response regulator GlnG